MLSGCLSFGSVLFRGNAQLVRQPLEAHVMVVFLHRDAAREPFRVWRGREGYRRFIENLRAVELVDCVACHDLGDGFSVLVRLVREIGNGFDFMIFASHVSSPIAGI